MSTPQCQRTRTSMRLYLMFLLWLLSLSAAGGGEDELFMPNPNELHIITKIWVDDDPSSPKQARQVYRRVA